MLSTTDFTAAAQSNIDVLTALSTKAFGGVEKLVALNLQVAKTSLAEAADTANAALSAKDPQSLIALAQPATDKVSAYARQVTAIVTETKGELEQVFAQTASQTQSAFSSLFEAAFKNAPVGSENGLAFWKSAVSAANDGFASIQKAAKQATDVAQANYTAATDSVTKATKVRRA